MGIFSSLFPKQSVDIATAGYLQTLIGYQPVFRSFNGGIYEADLCRSAIDAIATHTAKLRPIVTKDSKLQTLLEYQPNPWMDTFKFLYKLRTILEIENTAFIVPLYDKYGEISGFYPVQPTQAEIREKNKKTYVVFTFANRKRAAIEFERVGILNKFFYRSEFFGENNHALYPTLDLMKTQEQGIKEGIKQGATVRFLGKLAQALKASDIEAERKRWMKDNLSLENSNGIALFDTKYSDVKQINAQPYTIAAAEVETVQNNVYNYFGVNKKILQNSFTGDEWAAFYEGKVEPFALQLSLVLTNMLYTPVQKSHGNAVALTANRLQYATVNEKLRVVQGLADRGMLTPNEGREIFNLEPRDGGDKFYIRAEYTTGNFNDGSNDFNDQEAEEAAKEETNE